MFTFSLSSCSVTEKKREYKCFSNMRMLAGAKNSDCDENGVTLMNGFKTTVAINTSCSAFAQRFSMLLIIAVHPM